MDPDATLDLFLDAVLAGEYHIAFGYLGALKRWHEMGGFPPADPRHPDPMPPASWPPPQPWESDSYQYAATMPEASPEMMEKRGWPRGLGYSAGLDMLGRSRG